MSVNESIQYAYEDPLQGVSGLPSVSEKSSTLWKNPAAIPETDPQKEDLSKFVEMIYTDDKAVQLEGLIAIRKLLSLKENPPIQDIIDSGVVPKLLEFMKWDDEAKFQYESAWAVTNICSGSSQDVEYVVDLGGLDIIIGLLNSNSVDVLDQAVWALGNVAGDNTTYRNMCLDRDAMDKLVTVLTNFYSNNSIKRNAVWAMSNLLRGKPTPEWDQISKGIPMLKQIIAEGFAGEALVDALWGVSWTSETYIQEIIDQDCVPHLVNHLKNNQLSVLIPALRALGNVVTGNDSQTNTVLSCSEFLPRVFDLISNPKKTVRKEACWLISNIAAGNQQQIAMILGQPQYIETLKKALTQDVQEVITEASWALGNLASGASAQQIAKMVNDHGYIGCLSAMVDNSSIKVQQIGLEAILNVLNSGEGNPGNNPYLKDVKDEGLLLKIEDVLNGGSEGLCNLAEDILVFFEGFESGKSKEELNEKNVETEKEEEGEDEEEEEEDEEDEESEESEEENDEEGVENERRVAEAEDEDRMYQNLERED